MTKVSQIALIGAALHYDAPEALLSMGVSLSEVYDFQTGRLHFIDVEPEPDTVEPSEAPVGAHSGSTILSAGVSK